MSLDGHMLIFIDIGYGISRVSYTVRSYNKNKVTKLLIDN